MRLLLHEIKINLKEKISDGIRFVFVSFFPFVFFGASLIVTLSLGSSFKRAIKPVEIDIYLQDGLNERRKTEIAELLNLLSGVQSVEYVSREKAKERFKRLYPDYGQLLDLFPESPLPESYRVFIDPLFASSSWISETIEKINMIEGIEDVYFPIGAFKRVEKLFKRALFLFLSLTIFTLLALFVTLNHLIKLSVQKDYERNLKLAVLGVPSWIIKSVYASFGFVWALLSSILSIIPLYLALYKMSILHLHPSPLLLATLPILGALLGGINGYTSFEEK